MDNHPPNPAPQLLAAGASLEQIAAESRGCVSCPLYERATQTVFGEGPIGARFLLVGEQPGDREDQEGLPFVGPAGRMLGKVLEEADISRQDVYLTNVVKHFKWKPGPSGKPRLHATPKRSEILACQPWLDAEITRVDPALIVCLGATAAKSVVGSDVRVTRDHGRPLDCDGRQAVVTLHPAAVLRAGANRQSLFDQMVSDLRAAAEFAAANSR